ncbi:MAG: ferrous iron transport protein B [Anaerolineae bacterium]|nr:ferrous iron transport protein B [Anaerolineae bacterium]
MQSPANDLLTKTETAQASANRTPVIALAGQPNVGKSTIFNILTGLNQHVGNWPGKTVERKTGTCEHLGRALTVVDLPGAYSLTANSVEERIARDYIIQDRPDVVVAVVDAAILERSLYLVAELLLLPAPVILVLNMIDVAEQEGIKVEPQVLQAALGIPVIPMCATRGRGIHALLDTVQALIGGNLEYRPRRPTILPNHEMILAELVRRIAPHVPDRYPVDWVALKLLEGDSEITTQMQETLPNDVWEQVHATLYEHEDAILDIAGARYGWIERMVRAAVERPKVGQMGLTARLDKVLTHPIWGMAVLLAVLGGVFWLTYSIGVPLQTWLSDVLDRLAMVAGQALAEAPGWLSALATDGIIGGAGMVVTFLPILIVFFTVLAFLEDTGYMARIAYLTDRFMHAMGLHGKSFIPLLLGFGCNVPAILGTRIIETRRARGLTILLAPLVPCTARIAVVAVLAPVFFGNRAGLVVWVLVTGSLIALALLGIILHRFILRGEQVAFIMELPLYHLPNLRTIGLYIWQNTVAFLKKAGTIILLVSIVVWVFSYFPNGVVSESYLARAGKWLEPVGQWMGLSWELITALLTSFIAKENTIATLGVLYGDYETVLPTVLSPAGALAFLTTQILFIPCVATVATIKQEAGTKWMIASLFLMLGLSLGAGIGVYQLGVLLGL